MPACQNATSITNSTSTTLTAASSSDPTSQDHIAVDGLADDIERDFHLRQKSSTAAVAEQSTAASAAGVAVISSSSMDSPELWKRNGIPHTPAHGPMEEEFHPINRLGLYLRTVSGRGRGVFAHQTIKAGTLIEESPVLVLTKSEWESGRMNETILGEYGFCWSNGGMALGLGLGEYRSKFRLTSN